MSCKYVDPRVEQRRRDRAHISLLVACTVDRLAVRRRIGRLDPERIRLVGSSSLLVDIETEMVDALCNTAGVRSVELNTTDVRGDI